MLVKQILQDFLDIDLVVRFNERVNKALIDWVKDRACLIIAIPAYYFNIFGSIFGVLLC